MWQLRGFAAKLLPHLRPWEYWDLTPVELGEQLQGALWRQEQELERTAWLASHIINISGKTIRTPVTVNKLLGRREEPRDPAADFEAAWARHVARLREQGLDVPEE